MIYKQNVYLHNYIVEARFKAGSGCLGDRVLEGGKGNPQGQFGSDISQRVTGCLGGKS